MKIKLIQTVYASDLKSRAVLVMNYLIYRANQEGTCFPAIKTIAKECHISVNTVKRALDDLVDAGYVQKEARFIEAKNGAQTSNLYTLSEGMFASDDIDAASGEAIFSSPDSCHMEKIEHVTFESMAAAMLTDKKEPEHKPSPATGNAIAGQTLPLRVNPSIHFKENNCVLYSWATPRPTLIPP